MSGGPVWCKGRGWWREGGGWWREGGGEAEGQVHQARRAETEEVVPTRTRRAAIAKGLAEACSRADSRATVVNS